MNMLCYQWCIRINYLSLLIKCTFLLYVLSDVNGYRSRLKRWRSVRSAFRQVSPLAAYMGMSVPPLAGPGLLVRPTFDQTVDSEVYVNLDHIAYLHCKVQNQADYQVAWVRQSDGHLLYIGEEHFTNDQRFSISFRDESNDWCLVIRATTHNDSGQYECQLSTEPIQRFVVTLKVIDDHKKVGQIAKSWHKRKPEGKVVFSENDAHIRGTEALHVGQDISVECEVTAKTHVQQLPQDVQWRLNDTLLDTHNKTRYKIERRRRANKLVHTLKVLHATNSDTGKYTCVADNTPSKSMQVQVNDPNATYKIPPPGSSSNLVYSASLLSVIFGLVIVLYI